MGISWQRVVCTSAKGANLKKGQQKAMKRKAKYHQSSKTIFTKLLKVCVAAGIYFTFSLSTIAYLLISSGISNVISSWSQTNM